MKLTPDEDARLSRELEALELFMEQRAEATGSYQAVMAAVVFMAKAVIQSQQERPN